MKLYKHQQNLIDKDPKRYGIFWQVGLGKTIPAILLSEKTNGNKLFIVPKSLLEKTQQELSDYSNWVVITKEQLRKDVSVYKNITAVIADECQNFANIRSQITNGLLKILHNNNPERIYLLSGTPWRGSPWDVYSYAHLLGLNWNWYKFKQEYFYDIKMGSIKVPKMRPDKEQDIKNLLLSLGETIKMDDCFDVPEQIFEFEFFDLTKEQKKAIDDLTETNQISRWTAQHMIENGCRNGDGYIDDQIFKSEKMDRAVELASNHKKIAFVSRYKLQLKSLKSLLGNRKVIMIDGDTKNKQEIVDEANKSDDCVVLIQAATTAGYNLWSVPVMVFLSFDFSLVNLIQAQGRILRANHLKKNVYISLVCRKGSVDYGVYDSLVNKKQDFHISLFTS